MRSTAIVLAGIIFASIQGEALPTETDRLADVLLALNPTPSSTNVASRAALSDVIMAKGGQAKATYQHNRFRPRKRPADKAKKERQRQKKLAAGNFKDTMGDNIPVFEKTGEVKLEDLDVKTLALNYREKRIVQQKGWYPLEYDTEKRFRKWYVIDAEEARLGRLASEIAKELLGKKSLKYTPGATTGNFVIVINAEKVRIGGKKYLQKYYRHHTGFPGGMKKEQFKLLQQRIPERIIEKAVYGMLPKNSYGKELFKRLKVYKGPEHPHAAQKPEPFVWTSGSRMYDEFTHPNIIVPRKLDPWNAAADPIKMTPEEVEKEFPEYVKMKNTGKQNPDSQGIPMIPYTPAVEPEVTSLWYKGDKEGTVKLRIQQDSELSKEQKIGEYSFDMDQVWRSVRDKMPKVNLRNIDKELAHRRQLRKQIRKLVDLGAVGEEWRPTEMTEAETALWRKFQLVDVNKKRELMYAAMKEQVPEFEPVALTPDGVEEIQKALTAMGNSPSSENFQIYFDQLKKDVSEEEEAIKAFEGLSPQEYAEAKQSFLVSVMPE